jgi:hypothetical protein
VWPVPTVETMLPALSVMLTFAFQVLLLPKPLL